MEIKIKESDILEWRIRMMRDEIRDMKDDELYKLLQIAREEIDRRRAEVWYKHADVKYPIKKSRKWNRWNDL